MARRHQPACDERRSRRRRGRCSRPISTPSRRSIPAGRLAAYPGSPRSCARLLRPQDRLDRLRARAAAPRRRSRATLRGDRRAKAIAIDGWTALDAYVPPKERRGLVLIDPPFEEAGEFARLAGALAARAPQMADRHLSCSGIRSRSARAPDALRAAAAPRSACRRCCAPNSTLGAARSDRAARRLRPDRGQSALGRWRPNSGAAAGACTTAVARRAQARRLDWLHAQMNASRLPPLFHSLELV